MTYLRTMLVVLIGVVVFAAVSSGETRVSLGLSGPGAVNDSTIKAGEPVSVDVYWVNQDDDRRGFVNSFRIFSDNIKTIKHWPDSGKTYSLADSGKGVSEGGDVRAHSGWEGTNVWDFTGLRLISVNWDGSLPDTIGFGGVVVKNKYGPHEKKKVLSWAMIVPEPGTIMIDSTSYRPGGRWAIGNSEATEIKAAWSGPYKFTVVK